MNFFFPLPEPVPRILVALFGLHLLLGAWLGLSVDEAHYALYAAHPALSYFDHPPMVGWVQWPLVALNSPIFVLRLIPGALWLVTVLLTMRVAQRLAPGQEPLMQARAAAGAAVALLLAPLLHVLAIGLVPDTLLMALHAALMLQTLRMGFGPNVARADFHPVTSQKGRSKGLPSLSDWLLMGLLLGLAGLSKYTAIFTAMAVAACLLQAHGWALLRAPGLWLCTALALFLVSPVAIWNAQNHWISFTYQLQHGAGGTWQALHVLRFALVQLLAYGPLLLWGVAGLRQSDGAQRWLGLFFGVPFVVLAYLSGGGSSLPHWTAPGWVALAPFAGWGLARSNAIWHLRWLGGLQAVACVLLFAIMLSGGMPMMAGKVASVESSDPPNPFADLHGWDAAGETARSLAQQQALTSVSVQNWTLASRIGWYARPLPVHVLEDRFDQFDLWAGDLPRGGNTLLVDWSQMGYEVPVGPGRFERCEPVGALAIQRFGYALADFRFYACRNWGGVPHPQLRSPGSNR